MADRVPVGKDGAVRIAGHQRLFRTVMSMIFPYAEQMIGQIVREILKPQQRLIQYRLSPHFPHVEPQLLPAKMLSCSVKSTLLSQSI